MIESLLKASQNYIEHQLSAQSVQNNTFLDMPLFHSTIDLIAEDATVKIVFQYTPDFIKQISVAMLDDDNPDDETIQDLVNETTNQIAGSAKIVASENDTKPVHYNIDLPHFEGLMSQKMDGTLYAFTIDEIGVFQFSVQGG